MVSSSSCTVANHFQHGSSIMGFKGSTIAVSNDQEHVLWLAKKTKATPFLSVVPLSCPDPVCITTPTLSTIFLTAQTARRGQSIRVGLQEIANLSCYCTQQRTLFNQGIQYPLFLPWKPPVTGPVQSRGISYPIHLLPLLQRVGVGSLGGKYNKSCWFLNFYFRVWF